MGRLLITLFLIGRSRLSQPLLYLSAYIERHRGAYYDRLQAVRTDGDWIGWLRFFVDGVEQTANPYVSVARAQRILKMSNPTARQAVARLAG